MNITIANQVVKADAIAAALNAGTSVTIGYAGIDPEYAITINPTEDGFTVTDTTGGDQDASTAAKAMAIAAEFIEWVTDEDSDNAAEWMAAATALA